MERNNTTRGDTQDNIPNMRTLFSRQNHKLQQGHHSVQEDAVHGIKSERSCKAHQVSPSVQVEETSKQFPSLALTCRYAARPNTIIIGPEQQETKGQREKKTSSCQLSIFLRCVRITWH